MINKFDMVAIVGGMRTGSNLLELCLGQHPQLATFGEVYNPKFIGKLKRTQFFDMSISERDKNPSKFNRHLVDFSKSFIPVYRIFNDHPAGALDETLENDRIAKIILRRNTFDVFVSLCLAEATQQWKLGRQEQRVEQSIVFHSEKYEKFSALMDGYYSAVRENLLLSGQEFYEVDYPNIKNLDVLNKIADFVGLGSHFDYVFEPTVRQNPRAKIDYISNPDDVKSVAIPVRKEPLSQQTLARPKLHYAWIAENLDLAFVPILGTNEGTEIERLASANGEQLQRMTSAELQIWLKETTSRRAYCKIVHPKDRLYSLMVRNVFHEHDDFSGDILGLMHDFPNVPENINLPLPNRPRKLRKMGLLPRDLRNIYRAFARVVRYQLWVFKSRLTSDQYWPQSLLIQSCQNHFELDVVHENKYPDTEAYKMLTENSQTVKDPNFGPFSYEKIFGDIKYPIARECYLEDFEAFDFEV